MKKIKVTKNDKIIAFDFNSKLLKHNMLTDICKAFNLENIYIDVYDVDVYDEILNEFIIKNALVISMLKEKHNFTIKAKITDIPSIIDLLNKIEFSDLNLWNDYTEWEQHLKNKVTYESTENCSATESKFYLNYNLLEGDKVEIYCDLSYNSDVIYSILEGIINQSL